MVSVFTETLLLLSVYLLNVPFGYWRRNTKKFSREWILSIHLPVPIVFLIRVVSGIPLSHIPVFVFSFFLGQFSGGVIRKKLKDSNKFTLSNCMVIDFIKILRKILRV